MSPRWYLVVKTSHNKDGLEIGVGSDERVAIEALQELKSCMTDSGVLTVRNRLVVKAEDIEEAYITLR